MITEPLLLLGIEDFFSLNRTMNLCLQRQKNKHSLMLCSQYNDHKGDTE